MVFKFEIFSSNTIRILVILFSLALFPIVVIILLGVYFWGILLAILVISLVTINNTCETNFDKGVYIFRLKYLYVQIAKETYEISDFSIYSYKRETFRGKRSSYAYTNTILKIRNPKKRITKTIAIGDEGDVKKLINQLKNKGYTWKKSVS